MELDTLVYGDFDGLTKKAEMTALRLLSDLTTNIKAIWLSKRLHHFTLKQ